MSQFYHIGGVFPGRHWSSLVVIGCHWQSSVFRRTRQLGIGVRDSYILLLEQGLTCRAFALAGSTAGSPDRAHTGSGSHGVGLTCRAFLLTVGLQ